MMGKRTYDLQHLLSFKNLNVVYKLDSEFLGQSIKISIPVKKCMNISMPDFQTQLSTLLAKLFQCIKYKL